MATAETNQMRDLARQLQVSTVTIARMVRVLELRQPRVLGKAALLTRYGVNEDELREVLREAGIETGGKGARVRVLVADVPRLDEVHDGWLRRKQGKRADARGDGDGNKGASTDGKALMGQRQAASATNEKRECGASRTQGFGATDMAPSDARLGCGGGTPPRSTSLKQAVKASRDFTDEGEGH